ncbi:hypothetical protein HRbin30_02078 [bacterium HR30]|nr:hypothetical protein HRbin30_02078 [bacterium HR30]
MHGEAQATPPFVPSAREGQRETEARQATAPPLEAGRGPAKPLIARVYERLTRIVRSLGRQERRAWNFSGPPDHEPVTVPVVGIQYEPRNELVRSIGLRERVWLWREPWNSYDANAIAVTNERGVKLGHVSRYLAAVMAPYMDDGHNPMAAVVTELASDVQGALLGLKVGFYLPGTVVDGMRASTRHLEYCFEVGQAGTRYLSLECDEVTLHEVIDKLAAAGYPCRRYALSSRPAIDGRQYRWYAVLEGEPAEAEIQGFFSCHFGLVPPEQQAEQKVKEWMETFEGENLTLRDENQRLRRMLESLRAELERARENAEEVKAESRRKECELRRAQREELPKFLQLFAPHLVFVRDSIDVLTVELPSYEPVLEKLRLLAWAPEQLRSKRVQSAPDWNEVRFSTGRADDGRLYFKRTKERCFVLVSFKTEQPRDLEYLKKHKA